MHQPPLSPQHAVYPPYPPYPPEHDVEHCGVIVQAQPLVELEVYLAAVHDLPSGRKNERKEGARRRRGQAIGGMAQST